MQCPHCGNEVKTAEDYQVPQTTVYPGINKCYPHGSYTTALPYDINITQTSVDYIALTGCTGGITFNPVLINSFDVTVNTPEYQ